MKIFYFTVLLIPACGLLPACATLNPCTPYQGSVLFPSENAGEGCAIQPDGPGALDKVFEKIKSGVEEDQIKLEKIADGFEGLGIQLKKIPGGDGKTRELLISFDGDVSFAHNSSALTERAKGIIDRVSAAMNQYPNTLAKIHGHTDSTGSLFLNERLSLARANSVAGRMVAEKGIAPHRIIETQGFADRFKVVNTMASEPRNRRVEIRIVFQD